MGSNRLPYFPFYADDWLNDPVVMGMDADAEGCYIRLLARSWASPTPGVIPSRLIPEMAGLHRITDELAPEVYGLEACPSWDGPGHRRRQEVLRQMEEAFTPDDDGNWVQKRMVHEHNKLQRTLLARQEGARKTNSEQPTVTGAVTGPVIVQLPGRTPTEEVEVDLEVEVEERESKSKHLSSPNGDSRVSSRRGKSQKPSPADKDWIESFHEHFWPEYLKTGRHCSKARAFEAWMKIPRRDEVKAFNRLMDAFEAAVLVWKAEQREARHYPHAATWLNDYNRNLALEVAQ